MQAVLLKKKDYGKSPAALMKRVCVFFAFGIITSKNHKEIKN